MSITRRTAMTFAYFVLVAGLCALPPARGAVTEKTLLSQPDTWYAAPIAAQIADSILLYQHDNGGWEKNIDMTKALSPAQAATVKVQKTQGETTIDNGATWTQMEFLARVYTAAHQARFAAAFTKGLDYLLAAQYPNGGWPQFYPLRPGGYWNHITFNDDAMAHVLALLSDIAHRKPDYLFVDGAHTTKADTALQKGIDCVLKCQVVVNGKKTVWCAQHDETTLAPAAARKFELISLSGSESVGIVRFLMSIDHPSPQVVQAVQGAVSWFNTVQITGHRVIEKPAPGTPKGYDRVLVSDPGAPPLWARFYQIGTNRPFFSGRDSVIKYTMADIEYERRNGYRWYVTTPGALLTQDYPQWQKQWATDTDILSPK